MAFKFKDYQSTYVDPQRVAIAGMLRERYLGNMQANDQVQTALDEMLVSPFEGDKLLAKELKSAVGGDLEGMAARGDYENLGRNVRNTAKSFNSGYRPIEKNYNQLQAQKTAVDKMYEDGRINSTTKEMWNTATTYGYKGLERDKNGEITNFYTGRNPVEDVDLMEKYGDAIAKLVSPETVANDIEEIKWETIAGQNTPVMTVRTETSTETIPQWKIQEVLEGVNADPTVAASIAQQVYLKTYADDEINPTTGENTHTARVKEYGELLTETIDNYNQDLVKSSSPAQRKRLRGEIDALTAQRDALIGPEGALNDEDETKNASRNIVQNSYLKEFEEAAMMKAYEKTETVIDYDINWGHYNKQLELLSAGDNFDNSWIYAGITGVENPANVDVGVAQEQLRDSRNLINSSLENIQQITGIEGITEEDLGKFDRSVSDMLKFQKIQKQEIGDRSPEDIEFLESFNEREGEFIQKLLDSPRSKEGLQYLNSFDKALQDNDQYNRQLTRIYDQAEKDFRAGIEEEGMFVPKPDKDLLTEPLIDQLADPESVPASKGIESIESIIGVYGGDLRDFLIAYDKEQTHLDEKERMFPGNVVGGNLAGNTPEARESRRIARALAESVGGNEADAKNLYNRLELDMFKQRMPVYYQELKKEYNLNDVDIFNMVQSRKVDERVTGIGAQPAFEEAMKTVSQFTAKEFGIDILNKVYESSIAGVRAKAEAETNKLQSVEQLFGQRTIEVRNRLGVVDEKLSDKVSKQLQTDIERSVIAGDVPIAGMAGGNMAAQTDVAQVLIKDILSGNNRDAAFEALAGQDEDLADSFKEMFAEFGDKDITAKVDENLSILYNLDIFSPVEEGVPLMAVPITFSATGKTPVSRNFFVPTSVVKNQQLQNYLTGTTTKKHFNHVINQRNRLGKTSFGESSFTETYPVDYLFKNNPEAYSAYEEERRKTGQGTPQKIQYFTGSKDINLTTLYDVKNSDGSDMIIKKEDARDQAVVISNLRANGQSNTVVDLYTVDQLRTEMTELEQAIR